MALKSFSTPAENSPVPLKLYHLSRPIVLCMRAIGYLPVSVNTDSRLTISSLPFLHTLTLLIIQFSSCIGFLLLYSAFDSFHSKTPTESVVEFLTQAVTLTTTLGFRINATFRSKATVQFWEYHYEKLAHLLQLDQGLKQSLLENALLRDVARKTRKLSILGTLYPFLLAMYSSISIYFLSVTSNDFLDAMEKFKSYGNVLWLSFVVGMVWGISVTVQLFFPTYLTFFLRLYSAYFKTIAGELGEIRQAISRGGAERLGPLFQAFEIVGDLVRKFNDHFGVSILVQIGMSYLSVLMYAFYTLFHSTHHESFTIGSVILPVMSFAWQLYLVISVAAEVGLAVREVREILCAMPVESLPSHIQCRVCLTSCSSYSDKICGMSTGAFVRT